MIMHVIIVMNDIKLEYRYINKMIIFEPLHNISDNIILYKMVIVNNPVAMTINIKPINMDDTGIIHTTIKMAITYISTVVDGRTSVVVKSFTIEEIGSIIVAIVLVITTKEYIRVALNFKQQKYLIKIIPIRIRTKLATLIEASPELLV